MVVESLRLGVVPRAIQLTFSRCSSAVNTPGSLRDVRFALPPAVRIQMRRLLYPSLRGYGASVIGDKGPDTATLLRTWTPGTSLMVDRQ
jgi:hypothetical protein